MTSKINAILWVDINVKPDIIACINYEKKEYKNYDWFKKRSKSVCWRSL